MSDAGLHAWVDESIFVRSRADGVYILAAAVSQESTDETREILKNLCHRNRTRLHWREEEAADRLRIIQAIADMDLLHFVVVHERIDPRRQERARRKCLERLLFELADHQVNQVSLESRSTVLNRRDIRLVDALRSAGQLQQTSVAFARPFDEPMLWIPDSVAGAIAAHRRDHRDDYRELLLHALDEIEL